MDSNETRRGDALGFEFNSEGCDRDVSNARRERQGGGNQESGTGRDST